MKLRRRTKFILAIPIGLVVVWMLGDLIYSRVVAYRVRQWEATIDRDTNGVQAGWNAYTIGDGETALLLVHGINDSPRCWYKMAPALAEQGFTCRVMRLPGFAKPMDEYARSTKEQWIEAVEQEITALRKKYRRVGLIAHSLGGAVTISYLLENPNAVDATILIAPAVEVSNGRSPMLSTQTWHEFANWTLFLTQVTQTPFDIDAHDPQERDYPGRTIFTPRSVVDETFGLIDQNRGRAGQFRTPLMMVVSKEDRVIDWQAAEQFYQQALSEKKKMFFVDDAGHAIPVDNGWKELTQEIVGFVHE